MRISLGDYEFDGANYLSDPENWIYWVCWLLFVTLLNIIFLNFIVAEASNSYAEVTESLNAMILKEKCSMICESEEMMPKRFKNNKRMP